MQFAREREDIVFIFHKSKDHKNTIDSLEEVFDDPSFRHLRNDIKKQKSTCYSENTKSQDHGSYLLP